MSDLGRKPKNVNLSVTRPLMERAEVSALAPGMETTSYFFSLSSLINLKPGSEISGVPQSEI